MKAPLRENSLRLCLTLLFLLLSVSFASEARAASVVATILGSRGSSQVSHAGKVAPLKINGSLYVGDMVRIGGGAKATLLFSDGSQVKLNSGSTIRITAPVPIAGGKRSLFTVISGEIWARLRPNRGVQTASAVLGVAGTEFDVDVTENKTVLTVIEGVVDFSNPFGAVAVTASQQSSATPTTAPTVPITVAGGGFIAEWTLDMENAVIPREKFYVSLDPKVLNSELPKRIAEANRNPNDVNAQTNVGDVYFDLHNYAAAMDAYQKADAINPGNSFTANKIGFVLLETGHPDEAEATFRRTIQNPDAGYNGIDAVVGLSAAQLAQGRFVEAEKSARERNLDSANAQIALGLALSRQPGREVEADTAFETALMSKPEDLHYQAHSWLAYLEISTNDLADALKNATLAVKEAPYSGLAHGNLALVYFFDNQPGPAVREAKLAVKLNPKSVAASIVLGQSLLASGDVDGAARAAATAVALDPQLSPGFYLLGLADAQRRDYVHAERSLKESLRLTPEFLPAASALARIYNKMGRQKEALSLLTTLQGQQKDNGSVAAAVGEALYEQANYPEAVTQFERAIKLQPESAFNYAGLARVAIDANRLSEAVTAGQKAVSLAPTISQYHSILGLAYSYSRLDVQAEREYRSALSLDPQNALALVQLAFLNQDGALLTTRRTAGVAVAQGFLYDPAISNDLLRGGVKGELQPALSNDGSTVNITARDTAADGKLHLYGHALRATDDGDRPNSFSRDLSARQDSTYALSTKTNVYFHLSHEGDDRGLPGATTSPSSDDKDRFRFHQGIIASKTRVGARGQLFTGFFANSQNDARINPDRDSSSVLANATALGVPIRVTKGNQRSNAHDPELRFDWQLSQDPARPSIVSFGAAQISTHSSSSRDLLVPGFFGPPDNTGILSTGNASRTDLLFAQLTQRQSERLNFSLQLRAQRTKKSGDFSFLNLTGNSLNTVKFSNPVDDSKTEILPAASLNFQLNKSTTLRAFASRRATDVTSSILTPAETQLSAEGQILPAGLAQLANIGEFDIERQLPGNGLFKLFAFHSTSRNLRFDASDYFDPFASGAVINNDVLLLGRVQRSGLGFRYEKQLAGNLFGQTGLVLNRTRGDLRGYTPYQPAYIAISGLNYVDERGNKAAVTLNYVGSYTAADSTGPATERFPAKATVDLLLSHEPTVRQEIFLQVINLFDARQIAYHDVPIGGRRVQVGVAKRF